MKATHPELKDRIHAAQAELERLLAERDARVRELAASGTKPVEIAREMGITRGRVWQILKEGHHDRGV